MVLPLFNIPHKNQFPCPHWVQTSVGEPAGVIFDSFTAKRDNDLQTPSPVVGTCFDFLSMGSFLERFFWGMNIFKPQKP